MKYNISLNAERHYYLTLDDIVRLIINVFGLPWSRFMVLYERIQANTQTLYSEMSNEDMGIFIKRVA